MKKKDMAFYPYIEHRRQSYIWNMMNILRRQGVKLHSYMHGIKNLENLMKCRYIYLNWFEDELTLYDKGCLIAARLMGKKIIWVFHNRVPHDSSDYAKDVKKMFFMSKVATYILLHSNNSRKQLKEIGGAGAAKKAVYVPHINYCNDYKPSVNEKENDSSAFVYLYFGKVKPYKNIELLVKAFEMLSDSNAKLIIAGKASDEQYAEKIRELCVNNNIELDLRHISDKEVYEYMQRADVVVLPYDKKSSMNSGAMIAAFSCKKPVIVPDIAMARDYKGKDYVYMYGYKDEAQHIEELVSAMHFACDIGKEQNKMNGEQAYKDVKVYNDADAVRKALSHVL